MKFSKRLYFYFETNSYYIETKVNTNNLTHLLFGLCHITFVPIIQQVFFLNLRYVISKYVDGQNSKKSSKFYTISWSIPFLNQDWELKTSCCNTKLYELGFFSHSVNN